MFQNKKTIFKPINSIKKNWYRKKGMGMMEVIVAMAVISTGVVAGLSLTSYSLTTANTSEYRLIAANLVREGVEVFRQQRDSNWLAGLDWDDRQNWNGVDLDDYYRFTINFDVAQDTIPWELVGQDVDLVDCTDACQLYINNTGHYYSHDSTEDNTLTPYKRLISLREICYNNNIPIESIADAGEICDGGVTSELIGWHITSEVAWEELGGRAGSVEVVDKLYDWR